MILFLHISQSNIAAFHYVSGLVFAMPSWEPGRSYRWPITTYHTAVKSIIFDFSRLLPQRCLTGRVVGILHRREEIEGIMVVIRVMIAEKIEAEVAIVMIGTDKSGTDMADTKIMCTGMRDGRAIGTKTREIGAGNGEGTAAETICAIIAGMS